MGPMNLAIRFLCPIHVCGDLPGVTRSWCKRKMPSYLCRKSHMEIRRPYDRPWKPRVVLLSTTLGVVVITIPVPPVTRVTLYTAGHLHTAVPHCSHSRAPIVHTAVPRENNEHGCVYLRCRAVCKLPGCVEGHPWVTTKLTSWHCFRQRHCHVCVLTFSQNDLLSFLGKK